MNKYEAIFTLVGAKDWDEKGADKKKTGNRIGSIVDVLEHCKDGSGMRAMVGTLFLKVGELDAASFDVLNGLKPYDPFVATLETISAFDKRPTCTALRRLTAEELAKGTTITVNIGKEL